MEAGLKGFRALGRQVARAQDAWLRAHPEAAEAARQRLLALDHEPLVVPRRSHGRSWGILGIAAAAASWFAWSVSARPVLRFQVGPSESGAVEPRGGATRGTVGDWIAAPPEGGLPLRFSDGSVIRLDADARARVAEVTPRGARVVLEQGTARAHVEHRAATRWDIEAGPFNVRVVGTTFEVGWDPARDLFTVSLEQGQVAVQGCALPHERLVITGQTFQATCRNGRIASDSAPSEAVAVPPVVTTAGMAPSVTAPVQRPAAVSDRGSLPAARQAALAPASATGEGGRSRWRSLLARGLKDDAVDAAEAEGLLAVCDGSDAAALMDLADAARFAGRTDAAGIVLRRLRERFPADERASVAAFHLGRMAFDRAAYDEARGWFAAYLDEQPHGPLAREASGRVMEALERSGDHARARDAAKRYIEDFPNGPHAELARSIGRR